MMKKRQNFKRFDFKYYYKQNSNTIFNANILRDFVTNGKICCQAKQKSERNDNGLKQNMLRTYLMKGTQLDKQPGN